MMDDEEISESIVSMNTVVGSTSFGDGLLERLRRVNQLVQQEGGQGSGPRVVFKLNNDTQHASITGRFTVGRAHTCSLKIDDTKLSREHFEISHTDGVSTVRDLESKNGILVNDEPTTDKPLTPGDVIVAGKNTFVYLED